MRNGKKGVMTNSFFASFQLDNEALEKRLTTVGGSDVNVLAAGDPEKVTKLYKQKRGEVEPDDLSHVWPVLMGHVTEQLNLGWLEHKHGIKIKNYQAVLEGKNHSFMRCTLDGSTDDYKGEQAVIDAKFTMGRPLAGEEWKDVIPRLCQYYSPQLHWNAYLLQESTGKKCSMGLLSFIRAGAEPTLHEIKIDPEYQEKLIELGAYFMACVELGIEPHKIGAGNAPVPVDELVPVDMSLTRTAQQWLRLADVWVQTKGAAEACKEAESEIKKLVPDNASVAFGHGIQVRVSKNKAKKIEVMK